MSCKLNSNEIPARNWIYLHLTTFSNILNKLDLDLIIFIYKYSFQQIVPIILVSIKFVGFVTITTST